jgi:hypothetical protein
MEDSIQDMTSPPILQEAPAAEAAAVAAVAEAADAFERQVALERARIRRDIKKTNIRRQDEQSTEGGDHKDIIFALHSQVATMAVELKELQKRVRTHESKETTVSAIPEVEDDNPI